MPKNSGKQRGPGPRASSTPPALRVSNGGVARPHRIPGPEKGGWRAGDSPVFDVLVLGAGAAGLTCAAEAGRRGLSVLLLERGPRPGRKLAVSGGGKANFSNRSVTPGDYLCPRDPMFCRPALEALPPEAVVRRIRARHLPMEERDHGRLFLTVPARRLAVALEEDCAAASCRLACGTDVRAVHREADGFAVEAVDSATGGSHIWRGRALVLALGSPAWPQIGASLAGWRVAASLGHRVAPARPALVPLCLPEDSGLHGLSGISLPCRVTLPDTVAGCARTFEDDLLFTHTGLSGPLALTASLFWREGEPLELDLLPGRDTEALLDASGSRTARGILRELLPQRLLDAVLPAGLARRKAAELSRAARREIASAIHSLNVTPAGTEGLDKAEACAGGVDTAEVDPRTMESRLVPGLFLIGELLDVTGRLGGYNLHWAWASGTAAGRAVLAGAQPLTGCKRASPRRAR
ncbi:MAG: aminoacetone oxidase family FAD-binding enzyme [Desulfovibrio sp.]|uniref:NAD(P)/FAD-dependent oxidoreductase n=1 Tax=Desulfovibrio sp. TaxID=885 RepID=UPI001A6E9E66|nr:aminoacetone oxidase family FAD-binding enzyme [Desulfovibrio sp.]MBD5416116.1 aminoacetone oxidase family FAD-binding enzyme [Desulfovibrio sp.]